MRVVRSRCCARNGQGRNGQRRVQQPRQSTQRSDIDVRCNADVQGRAGHTVEHPHRNLKPALRRRSCRTAAENFPARPSYDLMNVNMAPGPRVPRIKNFADIGIVGVPSPRCTTPCVRTAALAGWHPPSLRSASAKGIWTKLSYQRPEDGEHVRMQKVQAKRVARGEADGFSFPLHEIAKRCFREVIVAILVEDAADPPCEGQRHRPFTSDVRGIPIHAG